MEKDLKDLLLKDLCARLPYEVIVKDRNGTHKLTAGNTEFTDLLYNGKCNIKPYLFPLSSITKEHREKISEMLKDININHPPYGLINPNGCDALLITVTMQGAALIEFYNKHHYDYNGLIPMDLAIDATGLNIYKKE